VTFKDGTDPQKLFVHLSSHPQGDLEFPAPHLLWWNGVKWALAGQGSVLPDAPPTAITYKDISGNRAVEVFVASKSTVWWGHQTVNAGFVWDNLGSP
jgi:hypothetical protein